jgi:DNA modification methylase
LDLHLQIDSRPVDSIRVYGRNARTHDDRQVQKLAASIRAFGFISPVVLDSNDTLVAGHGRLAAARLLGLASVPAIRLEHLDAAAIRALRIADNRLAELAGWDNDLLAVELGELAVLELDFEIEVTGFSTAEIDLLIEGTAPPAAPDPFDDAPPPGPTAVTRVGDLWRLGPHRLLCGDGLQRTSWERLLGDRRAHMVFTDPPYNVVVPGFVSGLGKARHRDFAMASGEMTRSEFTRFLKDAFTTLSSFCSNGALLYACIDWRHVEEISAAGREARLNPINLAVWAKTNAGMGSFLRSQHELVFIFKCGDGPFRNNVQLGRDGRYRTNLWTYPGVNTFRAGRSDDLADHPTVKPTSLVADAIRDCTRRGDLVLDAFLGSGTTILAAERAGRIAAGTELDPIYCDVVVRRWQKITGIEAVHDETGLSFEAMRARRQHTEAPPVAKPVPPSASSGAPRMLTSIRIRQRPIANHPAP